MTLQKSDIPKHYFRPEIRTTIQRFSNVDGFHRCGNGDGIGWYHDGKYNLTNRDNDCYHIDLTSKAGYDLLTTQYRTLYGSLNFFDCAIYKLNYKDIGSADSPKISREHTRFYTMGVDIDTIDHANVHGTNIHDERVKEAVEAMGQYVSDRIREFAPNSVHVLFSGGGIYVLVHHEAFRRFFVEYASGKDGFEFEYWFGVFVDSCNAFLGDIGKDFAKAYSQHVKYAKLDLLNSSKRVFKAPYSIHKKHPYAVIPLDPNNVKIDFEAATVPLSDDVVKLGESWYSTFDTDCKLLDYLVNNYFKKIEHGYEGHRIKDIELEISPIPIRDNWPPCIKNMLALPTCGEGATRALFLLATFLGQAGIPEQEAKDIFYGLARRWGKPTANIFETKFRVLHCPNCDSLRNPDNTGYPRGKSILGLDICKPDIRCLSLQKKNPRFYADKAAYKQYLLKRLGVIS